ncbi:MAG TPA: DNA polymerase III subunit beta [Actinomycetota bacterium]|nr:DNA polymerase III subunit beta [Actinomycetota bacterium]
MKLIAPKDELARALQTVLRSVGARAGIPALSGVLMELTDADLTLTTTDLELTTRVRMPLSGEAGSVVVPARYLAEIVRNLRSEDVEFVSDNGTLRITGGRAKFSLRTLQAEDFPKTEIAEEAHRLSVPAELFATALAQVAPAASRDETRPILTGVLFEGDESELRLVATDSYRLSLRRIPIQGAAQTKLLVPARAVVEVAKIATDGDVTIEVSGSQVRFEAGNVSISSRLIEGEFPEYRKLLPTDLPNRLQISRSRLIESLRQVSVMAQDATPVFVDLDEGRIRLHCTPQGLGEADIDIEGDYTGEPVRAAFNAAYLEAGVSAVETEEIRLELSDPQRPVIVRGTDNDDFRYLLMPIRVG